MRLGAGDVGAIRAKLFGWAVFVSVAVIVGIAPRSFAQEIAPTGEYKEGIAVGDWLLYPKAFVGAVYDGNVNQNAPETDRSSGWGVRFVPDFRGVYDGGIHRSTIYGVVDSRFFNSNNISATAGLSHIYEAQRDLIFAFYGNYTRQTDLFTSALNFNNGAIGPNISTEANVPIIINPFGTTPSVNPAAYNQFTAGTSVTKNFDNGFVILSGTAFHIAFDNQAAVPFIDPFLTSHDGTSYWVTGRAGYNVTPQLYVFAESSGIFQRFNNSLFDTNGYRVIGGFGNHDAQSLIRGEVFGGYQAQELLHDDLNTFAIPVDVNGVPTVNVNGVPIINVVGTGIPSNVNSAIFGGRLYYYPTRYWTLVAAVDQTLGISTILSPTIPAGTPTLSTNAILQTNYGLSQWWSVGARVGYTQSRFYGIPRLDNGWMAGASFNYDIWRNLRLTLDYQWSTVRSDADLSDFTRNVYTAGLTYRY
jgi:Putative beta-barrel porin 2